VTCSPDGDRRQERRAPPEQDHDRQKQQEREPDAVENVHPADPAGLVEDRKPEPVDEGGRQEHLEDPEERLSGPLEPSPGAHLVQPQGEARGEQKRWGHEAVEAIQRVRGVAQAQRGKEQVLRVVLDHQDGHRAPEPVEGANAARRR
jgi:hypothetical protein